MPSSFHALGPVLAQQPAPELLLNVLTPLALIVGVAGVVVIVWGAYRSAIRLIAAETEAARGHLLCAGTPPARLPFVSYLILGLEFLIAGVVIKTVAVADWQQAVVLAALVVVRTLLSLSLRWESAAAAIVGQPVPVVERLTAAPKSADTAHTTSEAADFAGAPAAQ